MLNVAPFIDELPALLRQNCTGIFITNEIPDIFVLCLPMIFTTTNKCC